MDDDMKAIFPNGFHALIVDSDPTFLAMAKKMLLACHYKVTTSNSAISAISILRERVGEFDLLLSDASMPEMSRHAFLDIVVGELSIPVIFMSDNPKKEVVMKGISEGASYYLKKSLDIKEVENLWRIVAWRKFSIEEEAKTPVRNKDKGKKPVLEDDSSSDSSQEEKKKKKKSRKKMKHGDYSLVQKKGRLIWTADLEDTFLDALNQLGLDAVPSKITKLMGVEGIERNHVASHLQKHRLKMSKEQKEDEEEEELAYLQPEQNYMMNPALSNVQFPDQPSFWQEQAGCFQNPSLNPHVFSSQIGPPQYQMHSSVSNYHTPNMTDAQGFNRPEPSFGAPVHGSSAEWNNDQATDNLPNMWSNITGSGNEAFGQFGEGIQQKHLDNYSQGQFCFSTFPTATCGETNDFSAFPCNSNPVEHTSEESYTPVPDFAQQHSSLVNDEILYYTNPVQETAETAETEPAAPNTNVYPSQNIPLPDYVEDDEFSFESLVGLNQSQHGQK